MSRSTLMGTESASQPLAAAASTPPGSWTTSQTSRLRIWAVRNHRLARLEEQVEILAIGDPDPPEAHAHSPVQRLDVQRSLGQRFGPQETGRLLPVGADLRA